MPRQELTKDRMAELLRSGAGPGDFDLIDGKLYEKAIRKETSCDHPATVTTNDELGRSVHCLACGELLIHDPPDSCA